MAVQKVGTNIIDSSYTTAITTDPQFSGTGSLKVPVGTTAQRPASPGVGMIRYNTDISANEQYTPDGWKSIATPPLITSVTPATYTGDQGTSITINGAFFENTSTVKFITADSTEYTAATVSFVNTSRLTATTPQDFTVAQGPLSVKVINASGLSYTLAGVVNTGSVPTWSTASGTLGSFIKNAAITPVTVSASDPDGGAITYSVTSGALPTGLSLNSSTGAISGTTPVVATDTTYNFTISATDVGGNATARAFSITVLFAHPQQYIYNYGTTLAAAGSWTYATTSSASTHTFTQNADNLYIQCTGSSGTAIGINTRVNNTTAVPIPSTHNKMDIYYYITIKDSNSSDTGGSIEFGLGTGANDYSKGYLDATGSIGTTDASYFTSTVDITSAAGGSYYFNTRGSGGQYANVQYSIYSIRTYYG